MEHNNAGASDSKASTSDKEVAAVAASIEAAAAIQDASAVAPTENPADAPNTASSPSTTGSAAAAASAAAVAPNHQSAEPTSTSAAAIAPNQKLAAAESTATSSVPATGYAAAAAAAEVATNQKSVAAASTATASAPPTGLKEAAAAASTLGFDDGSGGNADPPSCSTPMTSNKTRPQLATQQPFFAPQPFQPIINHPAAVANQSHPRMRITQTQYSPAFSPRSPNIDIQSYQHSIRAKLNDPNNHQSTFEEVITHPSHPFGEQFWELAMENTYLPNEFLGFDLLLDVFPMVYTILSNLQLGLVPKTNGGLNLNRSTHKNVDIMHVLPHKINKLVENKVFRHLHSSSGGDGGGEDPDDGDDGDDGGFDDLSSDEEDPDEKIHPVDETDMTLGYRESTKVQIKLSLSNNRKMAASLAVLRLFV